MLSLSCSRGLRPPRRLFFAATSKQNMSEQAYKVKLFRSRRIFSCIWSGEFPTPRTGAFSALWNFLLFTPLEKEISCLVQTKKGRAYRQRPGLRAYTCSPAFL